MHLLCKTEVAVHQQTNKPCRADEVVVITKEDLPKRVAEITQGRGAYAVINPIGGEVSAPLAASGLAESC